MKSFKNILIIVIVFNNFYIYAQSFTGPSTICVGKEEVYECNDDNHCGLDPNFEYKWVAPIEAVEMDDYGLEGVYITAKANSPVTYFYLDLLQDPYNNGGVSVFSIRIKIDPNSKPGKVESSDSRVCINGFTSLSLTNYGGTIVRWEKSTSSSFTPATTTTIPSSARKSSIPSIQITQKTYFRAILNGACGEMISGYAMVDIDELSDGGYVTGSTSVYEGDNSGLVTLHDKVGTVVAWQKNEGSGWVDIPSTQGDVTYQYTNITKNTSYRAKVQNGDCNPDYSNPYATISTTPIFEGEDQACPNVTYRYEFNKSDAHTRWAFPSANMKDISGGGEDDHFLQFKWKFGAVGGPIDVYYTDDDNPVERHLWINVSGLTQNTPGQVTASPDQTCAGNDIVLTHSNGNGSIIRWEKSSTSTFASVETLLSGADLTASLPVEHTSASYYRAIISGGASCAAIPSVNDYVGVFEPSIGGNITGSTTVYKGDNQGILRLQNNRGSILGWQKSENAGIWKPISNTQGANSYTYTDIEVPTSFKAIVQNGDCEVVESQIASIGIIPLIDGDENVCPEEISTISLARSDVDTRWYYPFTYASLVNGGNGGTGKNGADDFIQLTWNYGSSGGIVDVFYWEESDPDPSEGLTPDQLGALPYVKHVYLDVDTKTASNPGSVSAIPTNICINNEVELQLTGSQGTVKRWEKTYNDVWTSPNIVPINKTTKLITEAVSQPNTWFRAIIDGGDCGELTQIIEAHISAYGTIPGEILGSADILKGFNSGNLTLVNYDGDELQWQFRNVITNDVWTNTSNHNVEPHIFTYSNIEETTDYRVLVKKNNCQDFVPSTIATLIVTGPVISGEENVCPDQIYTYTLEVTDANIEEWILPPNATLVNGLVDEVTQKIIDYQIQVRWEQGNVGGAPIDVFFTIPSDPATIIQKTIFTHAITQAIAGEVLLPSMQVCFDRNITLNYYSENNGTLIFEYSDSQNGPWSEYINGSSIQNDTWFRANETVSGCPLKSSAERIIVNESLNPPMASYSGFSVCEWSFYELPIRDGETEYILKWYDTDNNSIDPPQVNTFSSGTYQYKLKTLKGACESINYQPVSVMVSDDCDENLNWIEATSFDGEDNKVSRSKNYFDLTGRPMQSQNVVFTNDGEQDVVFATQTLSDVMDREVLATLPAPLNFFDRDADLEVDFKYERYFMPDSDGDIYDYTNFDDALRLAPEAVGEDQEGTLGWYYSDNNTLEPYTPTTDYPYTRKEYYDDGTGEPMRVAGPGDIYHLDSDRKTLAGTFGVTDELTEYSSLHQIVFSEADAVDFSQEAIISISIDANKQSVISIMDKGEKVLMTAEGLDPNDIDENSKLFTCTGSTKFSDDKKVLYFYLLKDQAVTWGGTGTFILMDIINNEEVDNPNLSLSKGFYKISLTGNEDVSVTYKNTFKTISYNFYDDAGRLVSSVSPNGVIKWRGGEAYENIDMTTYIYNHQGWLLSMTEPDAGTTEYRYRKDGSIRFSQNAYQRNPEDPDNPDAQYFSYTHYDRSGRPVESGEYRGSVHTFKDEDQDDINVLTLGEQMEYSYAEYMQHNIMGLLHFGDTKEWVFTYYDLPDIVGPDGLWSKVGLDVATATDKDKKAFTQTFLMGAVSYTENANMKTWYSYDHRGRVDWMVQAPKSINESNLNRVFKIDYTYDFLGNVDTVAYKAYVPDDGTMEPVEQFYHHYEYDNNQRLIEVQAGDNPDELSVQAKYYYYLHGPLKRVELGGDKQGIDYVYTIQGWLKSINHPDGNRDPGLDGITGSDHAAFEKDLFAMTLEYFNGDYTRSGTNIESINAGQEYFNGNIRNITWRTGAEEHGAEPVMYTYAYDDKYQLKGADFGTPDFTNNTLLASLGDQYRVNNLAYDANGNIKGLHRYNGLQLVEEEGEMVERATSLHDFTGAYQYDIANTNKLTSITGYSTYQYNSIGQLTRETPEEGDIRKMIYDVTGKVTAVTDDADNDKVSFTYDDRGFRLMKKNHETGLETWYIRDASGNVLTTYEKRGAADAELTETMIYGSGRIGMYRHDYLKTDPDVDYITGAEVRNEYEGRDYELLPDGSLTLTEGFTFEATGTETLSVSTVSGDEIIGASQYELTDHLGNVRIGVMEGDGNAVTFDASMEADKAAEEEQYFFNMSSRYMDPLRNHTATGSYSSLLNPNNLDEPQHSYSIGPAINLEVSPGDTVRMKVYAQYNEDISDPNNVVPALVSAIAGGFGYISPVGEGTALVDAFSTAFGAGAAIPNADRQGAPKAYIQYIVFNKNMTTAQHGHIMVDPNEKGTWQKMELEVPIEEIGYIYIYVANESMDDVDVYFDDMEVQLIDAPVTNASDYYPFGLAMAGRSYTSEKYRFGYQGQFAELDEETGWNSFELRMYDAVVGRWMSTDPAGQFSSPYLSMANNPTIGIDIDGGVVFLVNFFDARVSVGDGVGGTATLYASLAIDGKGNMAILYGGGMGVSGTAGGAFTIGTSATVYYTADKISDICGIGFSFGFHNALARGWLSGGEVNIGLQIENDNSVTFHHGNTINPPLLADWGPNMGGGAIFADLNWTIEAMTGDEVRNFLEDFLTQEQIGVLFQYIGDRLDEYYKKPDLNEFNPDDLFIVPQDQTNRYKKFSHY